MRRFLEQGWKIDDITERSGVLIKNHNGCPVLGGSLQEIQAAKKFIENACKQRKIAANEQGNPTENETIPLDFDNLLDKQKPSSGVQNYEESLPFGKNRFEIENESPTDKYPDILESKKEVKNYEGAKLNQSSSKSFDENQPHTVATDKQLGASFADSANVKEPSLQTMKRKYRILMPHLDYKIFKDCFPLSSDIIGKVNVNMKDPVHVEIVGHSDSVQPFTEAMRRIEGLKKICIDSKQIDINQIENRFQTYQEKMQLVFPRACILIHEKKLYLITPEPVEKSLVYDILSSTQANETSIKGEKEGNNLDDRRSRSEAKDLKQRPASVQTTFGKSIFQKKNISLFVINDDVFSLDGFDCFVNPTNEHLDLSKMGGFSAALHKRAGDKVQKECSDIIRSKRKIEVGKCVGTTAGNLKYKCILHTVVRPWKGFHQSKYRSEDAMYHIKEVVENCLTLASEKKMKSIVFPAIGSGKYFFCYH